MKNSLFTLFLHLSSCMILLYPVPGYAADNDKGDMLSPSVLGKRVREVPSPDREETHESSSKKQRTLENTSSFSLNEKINRAEAGDYDSQREIIHDLFFGGLVLSDQLKISQWKINAEENNFYTLFIKINKASESDCFSRIKEELDKKISELHIASEKEDHLTELGQQVSDYYFLYGFLFEEKADSDKKKREEIEQAAKQGNAEAQKTLNVICQQDRGVTEDLEKALEWFTKAATKGHAVAQYYLGRRYFDGKVVHKDLGKALEWLTSAATKGQAAAQNWLGGMYSYGKGVTQNLEEGLKWLTSAADKGHADAQFNLGFMYFNGKSVPKDLGKAFEWLTSAANKGHVGAQYILGKHWYIKGRDDVPQDMQKAAAYILKAASQNFTDAKILWDVQFSNPTEWLTSENVSPFIKDLFNNAATQSEIAQKTLKGLLTIPILPDQGEEVKKNWSDFLDKAIHLAEADAEESSYFSSSREINESGMQDVLLATPEEKKLMESMETFSLDLKNFVEAFLPEQRLTEENTTSSFLSGFMFPLKINNPIMEKSIKKIGIAKNNSYIRYYPELDAYCIGEEAVQAGDKLMRMFENTTLTEGTINTFSSYKKILTKRQKSAINVINITRAQSKAIMDMLKLYEAENTLSLTNEEERKRDMLKTHKEILSKTLENQQEVRQKILVQLKTFDEIQNNLKNIISSSMSLRVDKFLITYPWFATKP